MRILLCVTVLLLIFAAPALAAREARLISFPAVSSDGQTIYFTCWGDIWSAPADSSAPARRLTDNIAYEGRPLLSPDGSRIAFISDRFGSYDIFVMPVAGGEATRLTWHMTTDYLYDWKADGTAILGYLMEQDLFAPALYEIPLDGSQPRRVSGPDHDDNVYGSYAGSSGEIVYTRGPGDWARQNYRGSSAYDIWLFNKDSKQHSPLIEDPSNDLWPQPSPDGSSIYFVSQRSGKDNLWRYQRSGGALSQLTNFTDIGITWPRISNDGDQIAFERLGRCWLHDIASGESREIAITFADDPKQETSLDSILPNNVSEFAISPNGSYFAAVVFGDIYILKNPDKYKEDDKPEQDLSRTHHVVESPGREMQLSWHMDSKMLTYISDREGQYDVYTLDLTNLNEQRITNSPQEEWLPTFDPTGQLLAYYSGNRSLRIYDPKSEIEFELVSGTLKLGPWQLGYEWSPDGKWICYSEATKGWIADVMLVGLEERVPHNLSFNPDWDYGGRWSPDGKYLAWTSESELGPQVMLLELDPDAGKFDTELLFPEDRPGAGDEEKKEESAPTDPAAAPADPAAAPADGAAPPAAPAAAPPGAPPVEPVPPVSIDFRDITMRAERLVQLPFSSDPLWSPDGKFIAFFSFVEGEPELWTVTVEERALARLGNGMGSNYLFAPDGMRLYFIGNTALQYFDLQGPAATGGGMLALSSHVKIERERLWKQLLADGWRQLRDGFYDPAMHGVDWGAMLMRYMPLIEEAGVSDDFGTIYRRMLGELGASHLGYYGYGSEAEAPPESTADFGVVYDESHSGAGWLVDKILPGGPALMDGSTLYPGDVILAVDGEAVSATSNKGRVLRNLAGQPVKLRVQSGAEYFRSIEYEKDLEAKKIEANLPERELVIMPISWGEALGLNYELWVRENRAKVYEASRARIAYQHIEGMNQPSLEKFRRELFSESSGKEALIIDVRFNGGGNTHEQLVDLLDRRPFTVEQHRDAPSNVGPLLRWSGPVVVLINAHSFSDAEIFPNVMKELGLATIIGETTGGNVIGTYDFPLMDGSMLRMPSWGWYRLGGQNMEGMGAEPDIYVHIDPNGLPAGEDNQLEAAIDYLLQQLGPGTPPNPAAG